MSTAPRRLPGSEGPVKPRLRGVSHQWGFVVRSAPAWRWVT